MTLEDYKEDLKERMYRCRQHPLWKAETPLRNKLRRQHRFYKDVYHDILVSERKEQGLEPSEALRSTFKC